MNNQNRNMEMDFNTGSMHVDINSHNQMAHHDLKHHFGGSHMMPEPMPGGCEQVIKCPVEKVCHRDIHHHVKHIQPVHTRVINRHIFNHSCVPHFTCSEENICCHNWHC